MKKCKNCSNEVLSRQAIYCSHQCYSEAKVGTKQTKEHSKKIGDALRGKPKTPEHITAVNKALAPIRKLIAPKGEKNGQWKGNKALYGSFHDWVYKWKGSPKKCEHCKSTDKKIYHWANISGEYKRELNDWIRLCVKCHSDFDKGRNSIKKIFKNGIYNPRV